MAKKDAAEKPKKFTFRGTEITGYGVTVPEKGEAFLHIHFRADFTDTLCADLGWLPLPDTFKKGVIAVELNAVNMILNPSSREFQEKYGFEFLAKQLGPFAISGIKTGEDSPDDRIITFTAVTNQSIVDKVKKWAQNIGRESAQLKGSYTEQQAKLEPADPQQQLIGDEPVEGEAVQ